MRTSRSRRTMRLSDPRTRAIASAHCLCPEDLGSTTRSDRVLSKQSIKRRQLQQLLHEGPTTTPLSPCFRGSRAAFASESVEMEVAVAPHVSVDAAGATAAPACGTSPAPPGGRGPCVRDAVLDTPNGTWAAPGAGDGLATDGARSRFLTSRQRGATDERPRRRPAGLRQRGGVPGAYYVPTEVDHYSRYSIAIPDRAAVRSRTAPPAARRGIGGAGRTAVPLTSNAHIMGQYGPNMRSTPVTQKRSDFAHSGPSHKLLVVSPVHKRPASLQRPALDTTVRSPTVKPFDRNFNSFW